ncbi:YihY/virulence factor BrkB family protein [Natronogracilivirga saccharolytica]|uniref:YihY/virulence factor BrkB family protein n=1 Tax=Natronogracilivirga saccharolytica TaxID=2812953 RepID=A0A8J7RK63_9BACT|nr:YihY/virulence factor BrkB family protein [Natronogracilivirga saccharolytica]MBP3193225.1 YihY/virulence factor BrkB family protein [Natronogracilivirga saccharolytica]
MKNVIWEKIKLAGTEIWIVIRDTIRDWLDDNIPTYGAALAFYTIFSIAPLLLIMVAVVGFIFGESAATGQLEEYMSQLMGADLARTIQNFVLDAYEPTSGIIATVISLGIILFMATTIITQLKNALNNIWNVTTKKEASGFKRFLIDRIVALGLILIFASLFVLTMMMEFVMKGLESFLDPIMPGGIGIWSTVNNIVSFLVLVFLFSIIFKMLPDIRIRWSDVAVGAVITALLFLLGRYLIGIYMGVATTSTYGAAGSFVVFLIWVYYNAMVFFLGAEFTYVYTMRYGARIRPASHAIITKWYADSPDEDAYGGG